MVEGAGDEAVADNTHSRVCLHDKGAAHAGMCLSSLSPLLRVPDGPHLTHNCGHATLEGSVPGYGNDSAICRSWRVSGHLTTMAFS